MKKLYNSTPDGQKAMFYRASTINALLLMNKKIMEIDSSEAWHPDNITMASDTELDRLRESISDCLVNLQRTLTDKNN